MMVLTHAFTGAAGGAILEDPILAFILGVVIHLVIDKIPHLLPENKRARLQNQALDGILTVLALGYIYYLSVSMGQISILAGALGGVSVDVFFVVIAGIFKPLYESRVRIWHETRQTHRENYWYILTDFVIIGISLMVLFR